MNIDLRITGATITGEVIESPASNGMMIQNGRLTGVLAAYTLNTVRGLDFPDVGLRPEDSLLDATFANILGMLMALPRLDDDGPYSTCLTPDIDVDRDGREAFCDSTPDPEDPAKTIDTCVDGDGTVVLDEVDADGNVTKECTEALDDSGKRRFVDGVSVEMNFTTIPTCCRRSDLTARRGAPRLFAAKGPSGCGTLGPMRVVQPIFTILLAAASAACGDPSLKAAGQECFASSECAAGLTCDFGQTPAICADTQTRDRDAAVPVDSAIIDGAPPIDAAPGIDAPILPVDAAAPIDGPLIPPDAAADAPILPVDAATAGG